MIFRTCVMVACAVPEEFTDAVACAFGVNAVDSLEAIRMTIEAATDAVDREGRYIGGVVIEAACRCASSQEFEGAQKYFHQPISEPGIFYVTGVTYTGAHSAMTADLAKELDLARERIARCGLPAPSFTHPQLPEEPPTSVRMVCSVCAHWVQVSNAGLVLSFVSGLDLDSREGQELTKRRPRRSHLCKDTFPGVGARLKEFRRMIRAGVNWMKANAKMRMHDGSNPCLLCAGALGLG